MAFLPITIKNRTIRVHKAVVKPAFTAKTVLVEDNWDFVDLWLRKRSGQRKAEYFWKQARAFYEASKLLPKTSSPLTIYYCAMNAAKALLLSKGITPSPSHGLDGKTIGGKTSLSNETITLKGGGVLAELCRYFGESVNGETYDLKSIFYNLPFIHRAFCTSYTSEQELFIPIHDPIFVRKKTSRESWFCCEIRDKKFQNENTIQTLEKFERDLGVEDKFIIRRQKRFNWIRGSLLSQNLTTLTNYHRKVRRSTFYIYGLSRLWYLKRGPANDGVIPRSTLTLTFMAMHRLSELARYSPDALDRHFFCRHNWLLSQFIHRSLDQFIDEISAEITGFDFMLPGYTTR
jgi:hypothetical protein